MLSNSAVKRCFRWGGGTNISRGEKLESGTGMFPLPETTANNALPPMLHRLTSKRSRICFRLLWSCFNVATSRTMKMMKSELKLISVSSSCTRFVSGRACLELYYKLPCITFLCMVWLVGLGAWFSLWVREVPGSNPGQAHYFLFFCCCFKTTLRSCLHGSNPTLLLCFVLETFFFPAQPKMRPFLYLHS